MENGFKSEKYSFINVGRNCMIQPYFKDVVIIVPSCMCLYFNLKVDIHETNQQIGKF